MADPGAEKTSVLQLKLPEIPDRSPFTRPESHLVKKGDSEWGVEVGRRRSKTLLVNRIRAEVDEWRKAGYPKASNVSRRLLQYWFDEDHLNDHRAFDIGRFRYYYCQQEAIETLIYLREVKPYDDAIPLIRDFYEEPEPGEGQQTLAGTLSFVESTKGQRKLRRYVPEIAKEAEQDLPRKGLCRLAVKMATGSGKTVVMALAIVWSYFHKKYEKGSDLATNFLVLAPNVIVYERLRLDFEAGGVFRNLPMIPPEWRGDWDLDVILRGESKLPKQTGTLFLTNIQQVYEKQAFEREPINPVASILGPPARSNVTAAEPMLDRVKRLKDVMVLNDEAHHVHDDLLVWNETLLGLDDHFQKRDGRGLVAWVDLSATPKNQNGTYFPWIVVDYPLAQAVEDRIVKTPLIVHQSDKKDPAKYKHEAAGEVYNEWITIAIARWREHQKDYGAVGEKPVLFVMAETTKDADSIAERLEREEDLKGRVLVLHVNEKGQRRGEISEVDLDRAREAARDIDSGRSRYRAVVSVLMLREGWDVRNVSIILGLRPFTSKANILPEQAVGRGLRLMRKVPPNNTQILELVGTSAFEAFVRELEKEGLAIASTRTAPKPGRPVFPVKERGKYDIEIPRTSASFMREYKNLELLDPMSFGPLAKEAGLTGPLKQLVTLVHGTVGVTVGSGEVKFDDENLPPAENLMSSLTNRVMKRAGLTGCFPILYPKVRTYLVERCFGKAVDTNAPAVRRALNDAELMEAIAGMLSKKIGELTSEKKAIKIAGAPYRLSEMEEFLWRRHVADAKHTIFNVVACYNNFEARFATFLDSVKDVDRFAKLAEHFTQFCVQYIKSSGAMGVYYPDFVAVQKDSKGEACWIIETKGQEDVEVAAKDAQMARWCDEVSKETGKPWRYLKVPQVVFDRGRFQTLSKLAEVVRTHEKAGQ